MIVPCIRMWYRRIRVANLTARSFERAYAKRGDMTVSQLHELGGYGAPCDCGEDGCDGWKMAYRW